MIRFTILLSCLFSLMFSQNIIPNLTNSQIDQLKVELQNAPPLSKSNTTIEVEKTTPKKVSLESSLPFTDIDSRYFGYSYFARSINFFDNIPTPVDYQLGPGDEIIVSLWGDVNSRENFVINKEGLIFYQNIGFINLSNKSISESEVLLKEELSKIYSSLGNDKNSSQLKVELGKLKSINVYFTGQVNTPGINIIHPFSDVFTAIVQAGGVKLSGSLRNIQLIRKNEIIHTFDFYKFFLGGNNNFSNIKILDGDIINIPTIDSRIEISGEVFNPGFFEFKEGDFISDMIPFTGGLKSTASSNAVLTKLLPAKSRLSEDTPNQTMNIKSKDFENIKVNFGDKLKILRVDSNLTTVEVIGAVKSPGEYGYESTLKEVLDIAGGFNDSVYRKSINDDITILRRYNNQVLSKEFQVNYEDSNNFKLFPGDKILVYRNPNFDNTHTYIVRGAVNQPGSYPLKLNLTVAEAIQLAGGLTPFSSKDNVVVTEEFSVIDNQGNSRIITNSVANADYNFIVGKNTVITANSFENTVNVTGNVYNPGLIAYSKNMKFHDAVSLAGGYRPDSLKRKTYIIKANGEIVLVRNGLLKRSKNISPGDTIIIPISDKESEISPNQLFNDLSSILLNLLSIFILVDRLDDSSS